MKTVFFGASKLGFNCLKYILDNKLADIKGIFTIPRDFNISYSDKPVHNVLYTDFEKISKKYKIPLYYVNADLKKYYDVVKNMKPDFMLAIGWYYMIPRNMRKLAPLGCAGIHASVLPKYRGGAPLVWAMINGEKETGVSLFYFDDEVDAGGIIGQKKFVIGENDYIKDVLKKAEKASLELLKENLILLKKKKVKILKQDNSKATYFPQRKPEDGLIDWNWDSRRIKNFIKALSKPYPGAFTIVNNKKIIINDAEIIDL
jgi:methionyl-tRNA formyltransferase